MHQWSGWPGAYCMKCGTPDPTEEALCCEGCDLKTFPGDTASDKMCAMHEAWAKTLATGCPPSKESTDELRKNHPSLFAADSREEKK